MAIGWTHTETPWKVADQKEYIYANNRTSVAKTLTIDCPFMEAAANAAFIVTAVNSHEELLRACKAALDMLTNDRAIGVPLQAWLEAAIAKAEGGK